MTTRSYKTCANIGKALFGPPHSMHQPTLVFKKSYYGRTKGVFFLE
jgi:hypothetical protein